MLERNEELHRAFIAERVERALHSDDVFGLEQLSREVELRDYVTDTMLIDCAGGGQLCAIKTMARNDVPLKRCGDLMLSAAVANNHTSVVKYLVCPVGAWDGAMAVLRGDENPSGRKRALLDALLRTRIPENTYVTKHGIMDAIAFRKHGCDNACVEYLRMVLRRQ